MSLRDTEIGRKIIDWFETGKSDEFIALQFGLLEHKLRQHRMYLGLKREEDDPEELYGIQDDNGRTIKLGHYRSWGN